MLCVLFIAVDPRLVVPGLLGKFFAFWFYRSLPVRLCVKLPGYLVAKPACSQLLSEIFNPWMQNKLGLLMGQKSIRKTRLYSRSLSA